MNRICIMGLGYIGLPTAIVAAEHNFEVIGFDVDTQRVTRINSHDPVIKEPEIFERLGSVLMTKNFYATTTIQPADYFIIAVPTPFREQKKADLAYVWAAADILACVLQQGNVVILESTVPVGTTDALAAYLEHKTLLRAGVDFFVAHCPERVLPGNIFHELVSNARIIGGINEQSCEYATYFYKKFVQAPLHRTSAKAAEMTKLVENSSRDVAIAFANEVAAMAYAANLDPFEIIELANKHPRVQLLQPSCGVGGHCIAVDPWFLAETFPAETPLIQTARQVNDAKPHSVLKKIQETAAQFNATHKQQPTVALLGLTYKPNVDDLRESPALAIAQELAQAGTCTVLICEPHVAVTLEHAQSVSLVQALDADIVVCLVKHAVFARTPDIVSAEKIVLDFCGLFYTPMVVKEQAKIPYHNALKLKELLQ